MRIKNVEIENEYLGIPLVNKEAVEKALATIPGITRKGGSNKWLFEFNPPLNEIFDTLEKKRHYPHYRGSCSLARQVLGTFGGYDGGYCGGRSNDIRIWVNLEELYVLNLLDVTNRDESILAEMLGVERGLLRTCVTLKLEPVGNRFEIDFEQLVRQVRNVLDVKECGEGLRKCIETSCVYTQTIFEGEFLKVEVALQPPDQLLQAKDGMRVIVCDKNWSSCGSILTGPLSSFKGNLGGNPNVIPPRIYFVVERLVKAPKDFSSYILCYPNPATTPKSRQEMLSLAENIAQQFR